MTCSYISFDYILVYQPRPNLNWRFGCNPNSNVHWCVTPGHGAMHFSDYTFYINCNSRPQFQVWTLASLWIIARINNSAITFAQPCILVFNIAASIFGALGRLIIDAAQNVWLLAVIHRRSARYCIVWTTREVTETLFSYCFFRVLQNEQCHIIPLVIYTHTSVEVWVTLWIFV